MRLLIACAALLASTAAAQSPDYRPAREMDRIVAVVNDDVIVMSELRRREEAVVAQLRQSGTRLPPQAVLDRQVLERMVMERLQLQLAERSGVRVDDDTLNRAVRSMADKNGLTLDQFRRILERDGYDFAAFREDIRNEIKISQLRQRQVNARVQVTDREVENYLSMQAGRAQSEAEYHLAHILIAVPEAASPEQIARARDEAAEVLDQIRTGADFDQVAVAVSDGQQALQGGDLGWRKAGQLPTVFADVVVAMGEGEVSEPIRSPSGFHLVKLVEKRGGSRSVITQTHARHILIRPNEVVSEAEAVTRLNQLRERIIGGDDFEELARAHSDDRGSAIRGGDLGWVSPGDMLPTFEEEMNQLGAGELSRPFQTQFGWHVVQVLERREHDNTAEVRKARAIEQIRERKVEEEMQSWLRQLRDEAYVELRLDE